jgi:hypothetical protein
MSVEHASLRLRRFVVVCWNHDRGGGALVGRAGDAARSVGCDLLANLTPRRFRSGASFVLE